MEYFIRNKNRTNILFVSTLLPYLLLCLVLGSLHNTFLKNQYCSHGQHTIIAHKTPDISESSRLEVSENGYQHNSATCQICEWLNTPSVAVPFFAVEMQFDFICISSPGNSNPILSSLSIQRFTIRPPPSFPCYFA